MDSTKLVCVILQNVKKPARRIIKGLIDRRVSTKPRIAKKEKTDGAR